MAARLHEGLEMRRGELRTDVADAADGDGGVLEERLVEALVVPVDEGDEPLQDRLGVRLHLGAHLDRQGVITR